jgi:hypothetical protein
MNKQIKRVLLDIWNEVFFYILLVILVVIAFLAGVYFPDHTGKIVLFSFVLLLGVALKYIIK